jgi:hypothetical protein
MLLLVLAMTGMAWGPRAAADGNFSLQVSPSPLVATVKPGTATQLELKIRNSGSDSENLKIEPRSFRIDEKTGQVRLDDTAPPHIASWISFAQPTFSIPVNGLFSEEVRLDVPKDAGFSYAFALVVSRQSYAQPTGSGQLIKGSVAVFALINVDRPGAMSKLDLATFTSVHHIYEYLPATFEVRFKNTGNTIVQPTGNIFVQRGSSDVKPLAALGINDTSGYILPGTERTLTADWSNGFPAYQTVTAINGNSAKRLVWNWGELSNLRLGRYTAKLVAVYSDGQHDVPIEAQVSFWVIPWKFLLALLLLGLVLIVGLWVILRKALGILRWRKHRNTTQQTPKP